MKPDKKKIITAKRIFKNGFVSFGRNVWLAIAAIAMMAVTLTILLFLIISNATLKASVDQITSKIDVTVYLKDSTKQTQVDELTNQLKALPNVRSVSYTSKFQALETYRQNNASNANLLGAISEINNPLPASLDIQPKDTNQLQSIKDFLDKPSSQALYTSTSYSGTRKQAVDKITKASHFFQQAGIVGIVVFVMVSMMIIFNTIRMTIFNRREELTIMRLLGATTWYIRGPFVVETMVYGIIAAVVSIIVCWGLFHIASSTLQVSTLGLLNVGYSSSYIHENFSAIVGGQILIGMLIGAISSIIATRRYLKFKSA